MASAITTLLLLSPLLLFAIWHISSTINPPPIPSTLKNKRIILLIAHPDDESMFFSPALQRLTQPALGNHVKILCLSTGNAEGLGDTRKTELEKAALTLGVRRREDVFVMDDPRFRDGMNEDWDIKEIGRVLAQAFAPELIASAPTPQADKGVTRSSRDKKTKTPSSKPGSSPARPDTIHPNTARATIDTLLTFDPSGISSHPNHKSLYHGSKLFLQQMTQKSPTQPCPITLYTLTTIPLYRKYTFILDVIPTYISGIFDTLLSSSRRGKRTTADRRADRVVFVSDLGGYMKAREAMVRGHQSQMVWFRWGWISLGRYMVVNDLKREM